MAITNLNATTASSSRINLTWTPVGAPDTQAVWRGTSSGGETLLASVSVSASSYSDTSCTDGTKYYYKIKSVVAGDTYWSNEDNATTTLPAPSGLSGTSNDAGTAAALVWIDNSTTETSFKVYKSGALIYTTAANAETYAATGLTPGSTYSFYVKAANAVTTSAASNTVNVHMAEIPVDPPAAPSGLVLTVLSTSSIKADWTDNANNEWGFKVYRSLDGTTYAKVGQTGINVKTYTDTGLTSEILYYYRVTAYGEGGGSSPCTAQSATTASGVVLAAPTDLTTVPISGTKVEINFTNASVGEEFHCIERMAGSGEYAEITQLTTGTTYYLDEGLTAGTTYTYKVRDLEGEDYGDYSAESSATLSLPFAYIAYGTGTTAESAALTALATETERAAAAVEIVSTYTPNDTVRFSYSFTATADREVSEVAVFDALVDGAMLGRKLISPVVSVAKNETFLAKYDVVVKDGGSGT
jgi:hypothetical protein